MRSPLGLLTAALLLAAALPAGGETVAVDLVNASRPTHCAEEDNVYVKLLAAGIRRFQIAAVLPPYIGELRTDNTAPDFTNCDMSSDPSYAFMPRTVMLYEDADITLVGHTYAQFWRPTIVPFAVPGRVEIGLHLVQLLKRHGDERREILVLYPADGYWRAKPLPPPHLPDTAYGSSFLLGPIVEDGRPFVDIRTAAFDPATRTFALTFAAGGTADLRVSAAGPGGTILEVRLDPAVEVDRPFAALRSMFVTEAIADAAEVSTAAGGPAQPILAFERARTMRVRFGRRRPSRHNTSAPDLIFSGFAR